MSPYTYTFIQFCGRKFGLIHEKGPSPICSSHCTWLQVKDKCHHSCSIVSIEAYAGLQLHKSHSQNQQWTVYELRGALPKKFSSSAILFDVKYEFCIAFLVISLFSRLSVALGQPEHSLCANNLVTMSIVSKCDSPYHAPDYTVERYNDFYPG